MCACDCFRHPCVLLARPASSDHAEIDSGRFYLLRNPHSATVLRSFFSVERLRLVSKIRRFSARGRGELRRRARSREAVSVARRSRSRRSKAARSRSRASLRFVACDRESCTVTLMPEGRCRSVTAVETLFTFCPPGPPDRANVSWRSASRIEQPTAVGCWRDRSARPSTSRQAHSKTSPLDRRISLLSSSRPHRMHPSLC